MSEKPPLVSVVLSAFNHEKYIADAIRSVLDQTLTDFELIVVNDGSTDRTEEIVKSFQDDRIIYIYQENQGPSVATNNGILASRGKYIANLNGDDVCYPHRLVRQYQFLERSNRGVCFSWVDIIDDDNRLITEEHFCGKLFNRVFSSRAELLNQFFFKGNTLNAVTAMVDRAILVDEGMACATSIQAQDFEMWCRLIRRHDLFVIPEKLVKYRVRGDAQNISFNSENNVRTVFELYQIYKNLFDGMPAHLFREAFQDKLRKPDFAGEIEFELEKAFIYMHHPLPLFRSIGNEKLYHLLQRDEYLAVTKSTYGFGLPELFRLNKDADIANSNAYWELRDELLKITSSYWYRLGRIVFDEPLTFRTVFETGRLLTVALPGLLRRRFRGIRQLLRTRKHVTDVTGGALD
jgi:glycosyltransferase involved in cell wall biosynthesis